MTRELLTGNGAAAWGARLAACDYIPAFPITPQTEIIETLAAWIDQGEFDSRLVTLDSEHSMIAAAGAAAVTGVRVFSATSSQGLLYAMEMIYTVSGWRAPFVLINVSRGLASPVTLAADHNDILAARDSGCLQLHCSTCQEVLDMTLLAYRMAEDVRIRLPVIVNLDGFYLSFTREPVLLPTPAQVRQFLPDFELNGLGFQYHHPLSEAVAVLDGSVYSYFRYQTHLAMENAEAVFTEASTHFRSLFGREYQSVESYQADDADIVYVMIGSYASKAKAAVDSLRRDGHKVGLVRPLMLRPLPRQRLQQLLGGKKACIVIDQNLAPGSGGVLYTDMAATLYGTPAPAPLLLSYIGGLGGRDISFDELIAMHAEAGDALEHGAPPAPRLLYTEKENAQLEKLQQIAGVRDAQRRMA